MCFRKIIYLLVLAAFLGGETLLAQWYVSYERGTRLIQEKRWKEAVRELTNAIIIKSEPVAKSKTVGLRFIDYLPYLYRATAYYHLEQFEQASKDLKISDKYGEAKKAVLDKHVPELKKRLKVELSVFRLFQKGVALVNQGKYPEAISKLNKVLQMDKNHSEAKHYLKVVEKKQKIIKTFKKALQLYQQQEYSLAIKKFNEVKQLDSRYPEVAKYLRSARDRMKKRVKDEQSQKMSRLFEEGVRLFEQSEFELAREKFEAIVQSKPHKEAESYIAQIEQKAAETENIAREQQEGVLLFQQGRYAEAEKKFDYIFKITGRSHAEAAVYLERLKNMKKVPERFSEVRNIQEAALTPALKLFYAGAYKEAIVQLETLVAEGKTFANTYAFLACVYATQYFLGGEKSKYLYKKAINNFRKTKSIEPGYFQKEQSQIFISPRIVEMFQKSIP